MLTVQMLRDMPPGTVFATGVAMDCPSGLFMARTGKELRWVAVRGDVCDWTIYCHLSDKTVGWIRSNGDKVGGKEHIRKCVPCDDEAFGMYRY